MIDRTTQGQEDGANGPRSEASTWDHSSHEKFFEYYANESQSGATLRRFCSIRDCVLRVVRKNGSTAHALDVADIGCGAGTQSLMWAALGHHVHGLDVNGPLLDLAKKRAAQAGYPIDFQLGSAVDLPWPEESMDVCLVPELLEHVVEWKTCLDNFARVVRPGGILFLTTTNKLCPIQQEFKLPLYSWYPEPAKHYFEHLAVTTNPALVNYAKYPAVNWFSFYSLRHELATRGFLCLDRFDVMDLSKKGAWAKLVATALREIPVLRWCAHIATPGTMVVAVKSTSVKR